MRTNPVELPTESARDCGLQLRQWHNHACVEFDPRLMGPAEVDRLQGDAIKARTILGWRLEAGFGEPVEMMADADLEIVRRKLKSRS